MLDTPASKAECCSKGKDRRCKPKEAMVEWAAQDPLARVCAIALEKGYYPEGHAVGRR